MMYNNYMAKDKLTKSALLTRLAWFGIFAAIAIFGAIEAYITDRNMIERNIASIERNDRQLDKQNIILQQILIKITRLETKIEIRHKK